LGLSSAAALRVAVSIDPRAPGPLPQLRELAVDHPGEGYALFGRKAMTGTRFTVRRSGAPQAERTSAACHTSSPVESIPPPAPHHSHSWRAARARDAERG